MHNGCGPMKTRNYARGFGHQLRRQFACDCHTIEKALLIEPDHFDHGVDHCALAVEYDLAILLPGDAADSEIEAGRSPGIELNFPFAGCKAQSRC